MAKKQPGTITGRKSSVYMSDDTREYLLTVCQREGLKITTGKAIKWFVDRDRQQRNEPCPLDAQTMSTLVLVHMIRNMVDDAGQVTGVARTQWSGILTNHAAELRTLYTQNMVENIESGECMLSMTPARLTAKGIQIVMDIDN